MSSIIVTEEKMSFKPVCSHEGRGLEPPFETNVISHFVTFIEYYKHGRRHRGAGGPWPPWIFKHGTNIVGRGLKVLFFDLFLLFFDLFFRCPPPPMEEASDIFRYFLLLFVFFSFVLPLSSKMFCRRL